MKKDKKVIVFKPANDTRPPREPAIMLPPATKYLSFALLIIEGVRQLLPESQSDFLIESFGFIPARLTGHEPFTFYALASLVTHMFLHGGWVHLLMNLGMLMAFGAVVEKNFGWKYFLFLFLATGVLGALVHLVVYPAEINPAIGASGAISGLFGIALMLMNRVGMIGGKGEGMMKLLPFIIMWIGISVFFGIFGTPGAGGQIAWTIHIGGFMAGLFLFDPVVRFRSKIH